MAFAANLKTHSLGGKIAEAVLPRLGGIGWWPRIPS